MAVGLSGVCVIGAGGSGLVAAKYLRQAGIPFDCFDRRGRVGEVWACEDVRDLTEAWPALNLNSPRGTYEYSDYPMPEEYADFPTSGETRRYFEDYARHFGFLDDITLGETVERVERLPESGWRVTLGSGESREYGAVIVANGHHNEPRYPQYEGEFSGRSIHSYQYRSSEEFRGRRVLVVGVGNSGSQISVEISHVAKSVLLSMRRGVYIFPHYIRGRPYHWWFGVYTKWWVYRLLPWPLRGRIFSLYYRALVGGHERFGMPRPDHHLTASLPTVCEGLFDRIGNGRIEIKAGVSRLDGNTVRFSDGSAEEIDDIIYCTGYHTTFPFLDEEIFTAEDNRVRLYRRIFLPEDPSLCFVGAFQAVSNAFLPMFEAQARLVAAHLSGEYVPPPKEEMERDIEREIAAIKKQFVASPRNNYQMNGYLYLHECKVELSRGRKRALRSTHSTSSS